MTIISPNDLSHVLTIITSWSGFVLKMQGKWWIFYEILQNYFTGNTYWRRCPEIMRQNVPMYVTCVGYSRKLAPATLRQAVLNLKPDQAKSRSGYIWIVVGQLKFQRFPILSLIIDHMHKGVTKCHFSTDRLNSWVRNTISNPSQCPNHM